MCGIAGLLTRGAVDPASLRGMAEALHHRGPDDQGVWQDDAAGIGLAHRRLAIVDLSPAGHQPMQDASGRYVLIYNGEIYNHAALRAEIGAAAEAAGAPIAWRGHSDTEVLLACIDRWGLEATLERAAGMFALALWDRRDRVLRLARDRFGEKPLYFGWVGGSFAFASELKALLALPGFDNPIDRRALSRFASRAFVPAPLSIYERIFKLQPAHILSIDASAIPAPQSTPPVPGKAENGMRLEPYWAYRDVVEAGLADPITDEKEALDQLEAALAESIQEQAMADVPVGAFLSGGIDSSTVVALYRKYTSGTVRTFSIGFEEGGFNEAEYAKAVAAHFGTEHNEHYVSAREARDVIPHLPQIYDEPFADASQVPTYIVSGFARQQVTVALSGDGGDELFGGYNRHLAVPRAWRMAQRVPAPVRSLIGNGVERLPAHMWNRIAQSVPGWGRPEVGAKLRKAAGVMMRSHSFADAFTSFVDEWHGEVSPVLLDEAMPANDTNLPSAADTIQAMYVDAMTYLPDDVMCKVDRAAMAVSLETRAPLLDHRVAAVAARIPLDMKVRDGSGKHILRTLLFRNAPASLFDRPKAGFAAPVGEWIKGPLRDWAEALLDESRLRQQGLLDAASVRERWRQHLSGERNSEQAIWSMLMFQAWLDAGNGVPQPSSPPRLATAG